MSALPASLPECLPLHHGGTLLHGRVTYTDVGPADGEPVVVLGGVSARAPLDWWPGVVGEGHSLDPARKRLISIGYLTVPGVDPRDQAHAVIAVLDHLGIGRASVVGASYGGMVALALAAVASARIDRLVVLAAAHRPHPLGTAWRTVQRRILALGRRAGDEAEAVALARMLAMTTFRTPEEFAARFGGPVELDGDGVRAPVDGYLAHHGAKYVQRFRAAEVSALLGSIDLHAVEPAHVTVPTHLIGFRRDALVPVPLLQELADALPTCLSFTILDSVHGHDGFLTDADRVDPLIRCALEAP